jgi:uncharacterized protein (DUF2062 family)
MLFRRRTKQSLFNKIRNVIWPAMGFRRVMQYYKHRSIRIPASEHSIASGLAFGCAISWTPTFGLHLLQCAIFSWITKANWIASFLGSALGNPWTSPLLMIIAYHVGKAFFVATGHADFLHGDGDAHKTFGGFLKSILEGHVTIALLSANFKTYLLPTLIGGYTMALATFPLFYYPFYYMVKGARTARRARIEKKVHLDAIEVTGQAK